MEDVERAYLAGLFDGEGNTNVIVSVGPKPTKQGKRFYKTHRVQLDITNQDKRVLKEVRLLFGKGGIYTQKSVHHFKISKPQDIIKIIELLRSYIRVKKAELENIYNASKFILRVRGSSKRHKWTPEESARFLQFAETNRALKGPGKRGRKRKYPIE